MSSFSGNETQLCETCGHSLEPLEDKHVARSCKLCGRTFYVAQGGAETGVEVRAGDRLSLWIDFSRFTLDRDHTTVQFSREGIRWFVSQIILGGMPKTPDELDALLEQYKEQADAVLENSPLFEDLDLENEGDAPQVFSILEANKGTPEWWATAVSVLKDQVQKAIQMDDARRAAWEATRLANFRAMLIFSKDIEKTLWRGYTIKDLVDLQSTVEQPTKPLILVEGQTDPQYIETALELLGRDDLLTRVDVQWVGHEEAGQARHTGYEALNRIVELTRAKPQIVKQKIMLLYDCDVNKSDEEIGLLSVRGIPQNPSNTKAKKGIENLFPEDYFDPELHPEFYSSYLKPGHYGDDTRVRRFEKTDFCRAMCVQTREPADFQGFSVIVDIIDKWLDM